MKTAQAMSFARKCTQAFRPLCMHHNGAIISFCSVTTTQHPPQQTQGTKKGNALGMEPLQLTRMKFICDNINILRSLEYGSLSIASAPHAPHSRFYLNTCT